MKGKYCQARFFEKETNEHIFLQETLLHNNTEVLEEKVWKRSTKGSKKCE